MMVVFEVFVAPDADPDQLLTPETLRETQAQIMTVAEAKKVGFDGLSDPGDRIVRLIAVAKRDAAWIHRALESHAGVQTFRTHEVD